MYQRASIYILLKQVFMKGYNFPANIQLAVNLQASCLLPFFFQLLCIRQLCPISWGFWEALKIELVHLDSHAVAKKKKKANNVILADTISAETADHCEHRHYNINILVPVAASLKLMT